MSRRGGHLEGRNDGMGHHKSLRGQKGTQRGVKGYRGTHRVENWIEGNTIRAEGGKNGYCMMK